MAEFVGATAALAGLDVEFQEVLPGRPNVLARLTPPSPPSARLVLAPHLDTVNGVTRQFEPQARGGRIFGRGACDTKGSVAAMLEALCELARSGRRPARTEILFAGLIDEENGQAGSRALASSGLRADLAIVGEPTRLLPVTAHKGSLWLRVRTRGRAAHGATPECGKNAVLEMARVVESLETAYRERLRKRKHSLLGNATVSVGVIRGGTQPNIVPDLCEIEVDRRTLPGETETGVLRELNGFLRTRGLRAECTSVKQAPCLALETDPRLPLVAEFVRATGSRRASGVNYFCDASVLSQGGIPSIVFGPGDIAQAHTAEEWISVGSLNRAQSILARYLRGLP